MPKFTKGIKVTPRERMVLSLIAMGLTSRQIATKLKISFQTVQTHRKNMVRRMKVKSMSALVGIGIRYRWI